MNKKWKPINLNANSFHKKFMTWFGLFLSALFFALSVHLTISFVDSLMFHFACQNGNKHHVPWHEQSVETTNDMIKLAQWLWSNRTLRGRNDVWTVWLEYLCECVAAHWLMKLQFNKIVCQSSLDYDCVLKSIIIFFHHNTTNVFESQYGIGIFHKIFEREKSTITLIIHNAYVHILNGESLDRWARNENIFEREIKCRPTRHINIIKRYFHVSKTMRPDA